MAFLNKNTTRLFTTLNLMPGSLPEPAITNQAFLYSFLDAGVWMRSLAMASHVAVLENEKASRLQLFAASVGIYQQIGLSIEDALATLVAWSVWAVDRSVILPDIASRMMLRAAPEEKYGRARIEEIREKFSKGKKVHLDARQYLRVLVQDQPLHHLPALFGLNWKAHPSVKLVPKDKMASWTMLPKAVSEYIELLTDPSSELATAYSNILKHGPQLVLDNPRDACLRMEHPEKFKGSVPDTELVRILLCGSQTSVTDEELATGVRVAPFLLNDPDNAGRLLRRSVLSAANFLYMLGLYLFKDNFRDAAAPDASLDPGLQTLQASHFDTL